MQTKYARQQGHHLDVYLEAELPAFVRIRGL